MWIYGLQSSTCGPLVQARKAGGRGRLRSRCRTRRGRRPLGTPGRTAVRTTTPRAGSRAVCGRIRAGSRRTRSDRRDARGVAWQPGRGRGFVAARANCFNVRAASRAFPMIAGLSGESPCIPWRTGVRYQGGPPGTAGTKGTRWASCTYSIKMEIPLCPGTSATRAQLLPRGGAIRGSHLAPMSGVCPCPRGARLRNRPGEDLRPRCRGDHLGPPHPGRLTAWQSCGGSNDFRQTAAWHR